MTARKVLMVLPFICCILCAGNVHAAWSSDPAANNAICSAADGQAHPTIISDGIGGAISI